MVLVVYTLSFVVDTYEARTSSLLTILTTSILTMLTITMETYEELTSQLSLTMLCYY